MMSQFANGRSQVRMKLQTSIEEIAQSGIRDSQLIQASTHNLLDEGWCGLLLHLSAKKLTRKSKIETGIIRQRKEGWRGNIGETTTTI